MMSFEEFKNGVREGEAKGEIKTSAPLSDFDLAVQWAVGSIGDRKGYPCDITIDEIWQELYLISEDIINATMDFLRDCTVSVISDEPQTEDTCKGCVNETDCPWK